MHFLKEIPVHEMQKLRKPGGTEKIEEEREREREIRKRERRGCK